MNDSPASRRTARLAVAFALALWAGMSAGQQTPYLDAADALRASQSVVGQPVGDFTLLDREARPVALAAYRGKPLLVSFIYSGCFQVCPATTRALHDAVEAMESRFGAGRFNVASIGFNQPADSPQALKAFAAQNRIARANWEFLSPPAATVEPLTRSFGFRYAATPAGFDHVVQLTLVDAQGRIVRHLYGERLLSDELAAPLQQLLAGQALPPPGALDALVEQVRLLCTVYDPATGTYRVDYSIALEAAGGLTFILSVALYMLNEWRVRRRGSPHGGVRQGA